MWQILFYKVEFSEEKLNTATEKTKGAVWIFDEEVNAEITRIVTAVTMVYYFDLYLRSGPEERKKFLKWPFHHPDHHSFPIGREHVMRDINNSDDPEIRKKSDSSEAYVAELYAGLFYNKVMPFMKLKRY